MKIFRHSENDGYTTLEVTKVDGGYYLEIIDRADLTRQQALIFLPNVEATALGSMLVWYSP
jgi:hypothetical protein